jgi:hypothetical protein
VVVAQIIFLCHPKRETSQKESKSDWNNLTKEKPKYQIIHNLKKKKKNLSFALSFGFMHSVREYISYI